MRRLGGWCAHSEVAESFSSAYRWGKSGARDVATGDVRRPAVVCHLTDEVALDVG